MTDEISPSTPLRPFSRRRFLAGVPAVALVAAGIACGDDDDDGDETTPESEATSEATAAASSTTDATTASETATSDATEEAAAGAWSYTDDRGREISLPSRPQRIVAVTTCAAALWDAGIQPTAIWGNIMRPDGSRHPEIGNIDLDVVEVLAESYGDLDLEALAALQPDVIISPTYDGETLWPITEEDTPQLTQIAPTLAINPSGKPGADIIARYTELATALGADVDSPEQAAARDEFAAVIADLEDVAASSPGLTVVAVAANLDEVWLGDPSSSSDLMDLAGAGIDVLWPESTETGQVSWEQFGTLQADVILLDARGGRWLPATDLAGVGSWDLHPAVQAGQIVDWHSTVTFSYQSYAPRLQEWANALREANPDIV